MKTDKLILQERNIVCKIIINTLKQVRISKTNVNFNASRTFRNVPTKRENVKIEVSADILKNLSDPGSINILKNCPRRSISSRRTFFE